MNGHLPETGRPIDGFFARFPRFSEEERRKIRAAWDELCTKTNGAVRENGEDASLHPLRAAEILASLSADADTAVGALLYSAAGPEGISPQERERLQEKYGAQAAALTEGAARLSGLHFNNQNIHQAEAVRKMFFAMVDDVRIILILLVGRLDDMRNLKSFSAEQQKALAQETADIWAPLANRLGISTVKDELEDLSLKFTNREVFDYIKALVAAKKSERAALLEKAVEKIRAGAEKAGIAVEVQSRAKHFWSIYQKMKRRGKSAGELYDLLAVRILCGTAAECYSLLGIVHTIWKPLEGRFKDYISMPKANGYQSLHTTVMCDEGHPLEIQIRTRAMHEIAEKGVASHWLYKKGSSNEEFSAESIPVINRLRDLVRERSGDDEFLAEIKSELLGDSIYVFTPKGDVIELPSGSTAIDFAYAIHSAVGEKIAAAKADGAIIPLSRPLKNTQVVEVITHPQAHPTVNQYNSAHTAKARQKIRAWLQANGGFESDGRHSGKPERTEKPERQTVRPSAEGMEPRPEGTRRVSGGPALKIRVEDSTKYMVKFAKCCAPAPGVPIVGYVSRGRGVIIHRAGCPNVRRIPEGENRLISVEWAE